MTEEKLQQTLQAIGIGPFIRRNHNLTACCPNHQESRPSWGIRLDPPHMHGCFSCGFKGSLYTLLIDIGRVSPAQARAICEIDQEFEFQSLAVGKKVPKEIEEFNLYPFALEGEGLRYMTEERGVRRSVLKECGIVYDRKQKRVLFPWYSGDKLIAVTGRTVDPNVEDQEKIKAYFDTRKGALLYLPQRVITAEPLVIVEGEIDALKVYQAGFHNVGATGQGRLTSDQKVFVQKSPCQSVIIFTDDDKTGERLAFDIHEALRDHKTVLQVDYRKHRGPKRIVKSDPGALRPEVVRKLITTAQACVFSHWSNLKY